MPVNVSDIKRNNRLSDVVGKRVKLQKDGREFKSCCPFHNDKTPSFTVNDAKGFYHCFGCGAHGDVIDFVMEFDGVPFTEAASRLGGQDDSPAGEAATRRTAVEHHDPYADYEPLPVPAEQALTPGERLSAWNPKRDGRTATYTPSMTFRYGDHGYVIRADLSDGVKITPQIRWCRRKADGAEGWCHYPFGEPRPLYLASDLSQHVLIVEGEKAADAAQRLLPRFSVVTWPGGTNAVSKASWAALAGMNITIWPDADEPGTKAAAEIAAILHGLGCTVRQVNVEGQPKGWDLADAEADGWTGGDVAKFAKERTFAVEPEPAPEPEPEPEVEPEVEPDGEIAIQDAPFRFLGYNDGTYYYLPNKTQQIVELSPSGHTKLNLISIAPMEFWERTFPKNTWDLAAHALMQTSGNVGIFEGEHRIRGRGAWLDQGRAVLHLGTQVYVNGERFRPANVPSRHVYQAGPNMDVDFDSEPATDAEAKKFVEICTHLSWENPLSGNLLAGWCVIAPVCGILKWRPHIWISGPAGSGKSTVLNDIIKRMINSVALHIEGKTTEAGIRQKLLYDARPILFDEAEAEDQRSAANMQGVLDILRISSSGGSVAKGTADGKGKTFTLRTCACLSSINTSINHFADETRFSKLILRKNTSPDRESHYRELLLMIQNTMTDGFSSRMLMRSIKYLDVLQENCRTFTDAAARVLDNRRAADQIGTMLAGLYLCHSTKRVTADAAERWISQHDWTFHTAIDAPTDETRLLEYIAAHRIRVNMKEGYEEVPIGELIALASSKGSWSESENWNKRAADKELRRIGMMIEGDYLVIANRSANIKKMLAGTPWHSEWGRPLRELHNAEITQVVYFAPGLKTRGTKLPLALFGDNG